MKTTPFSPGRQTGSQLVSRPLRIVQTHTSPQSGHRRTATKKRPPNERWLATPAITGAERQTRHSKILALRDSIVDNGRGAGDLKTTEPRLARRHQATKHRAIENAPPSVAAILRQSGAAQSVPKGTENAET